jgi:hypothetical protein
MKGLQVCTNVIQMGDNHKDEKKRFDHLKIVLSRINETELIKIIWKLPDEVQNQVC